MAMVKRKLQLGCGNHPIDGWVNTDGDPGAGIEHVELLEPLPFPDESFDRVFFEHVLEHLTQLQGLALLHECSRVLAPKGRIRIGVPDLGMYVAFLQDRSTWTDDMKAFANLCAEWHHRLTPCQVINGLFSMGIAEGDRYPHRFQYDEPELRSALTAAGFVNVQRYSVGESDDFDLRGIEHVERMPPRMLAVETLVLEATKPAR